MSTPLRGDNDSTSASKTNSGQMSPTQTESRLLPEPMDDEHCHHSGESTTLGAFLQMFSGGLIAPTRTTYDAITLLLTAPTEAERDTLTKQWRDHKLEELNFIGVVGALLAGCLTSTGSWPSVLQNGQESPWTVRTCWYAGIVFALFAVLTAAQQSIRLHRMSGHKNALKNIRHFMGSRRRDREGVMRVRPRRAQVYGWQASIMFLTLSVVAMVVGMSILIWTAAAYGPFKPEGKTWWDQNAMLAVTWSIITLLTLSAFVAAQVSLSMRSDDD